MKKIAFILIILLIFTLPSCTKQERPTCREILGSLVTVEIGLPAGRIYSMTAPEGNSEYLSEHLVNVLYGDGERPVMADGWLDLALFLPTSSHPCEFAVILCDTPDTATDTARLLCRRLDTIRTVKGEGEFSSMIENATVAVIGNFALLIISSDTETAIKSASKIIG